MWNRARDAGELQHRIKLTRWALGKNPEDLSPRQRAKLTWLEKVNQSLYRAYLLKEALRLIFQLPAEEALELLENWLQWAWRSGLEHFVVVADRIARHIDELIATIVHSVSNALVEATNTRIRLITRRAYGFHSPKPLIALAMLSCGDYRPALPGRPA
jgi:transposase